MSNDERPESLAAQAAAWVPPWERPRSEPDRDYQAAHRVDGVQSDDNDFDSDGAGSDRAGSDRAGTVERIEADVEAEVRAEQLADLEGADHDERPDDLRPDDDEDRSAAGLSDDDDDFDEAFEGGNPPGYQVSSPDEAVVDQPRELPGEDEVEPTEVHLGGEVPLPVAVEAAVEAGGDEGGAPVDAPFPADGDDAGDVFDAAADDDVSDDEVDLPFVEVVPATDDDEEAALAADDAPFRRSGASSAVPDPSGEGTDDDGPVGVDGRLEGEDHDEYGEEGPLDDGGLEDEASAYAAGAADALDALRGAANGDGAGDAQFGERPAVEPVGDAGRAEAGSAVPAQGRRRRISDGDSPAASSRTSASGEAGSGGAAAAVSVATPALEAEAEREAETTALPALEDDAELASALEAIMLVVDEPVGELQLAEILEQSAERIARTLDDLSARYTAAGHGFDLRRAAGGWRMYTRPEYAAYVERFVLDGQSVRLTQAALETLAVVAYKQPVTRSRISAIRGVNCDGVMRTLVTRGLIEECGTEGETGAHLYRTTALFLEKLGLNSVDQLPPLAPFLPDDVEEVLDASG